MLHAAMCLLFDWKGLKSDGQQLQGNCGHENVLVFTTLCTDTLCTHWKMVALEGVRFKMIKYKCI